MGNLIFRFHFTKRKDMNRLTENDCRHNHTVDKCESEECITQFLPFCQRFWTLRWFCLTGVFTTFSITRAGFFIFCTLFSCQSAPKDKNEWKIVCGYDKMFLTLISLLHQLRTLQSNFLPQKPHWRPRMNNPMVPKQIFF